MAPQILKTRLFAPLLAAGLLFTPVLLSADDGPSAAELYGRAMVAVETEKRPDALQLLRQFRERFPKHALAPRAVAPPVRMTTEARLMQERAAQLATVRSWSAQRPPLDRSQVSPLPPQRYEARRPANQPTSSFALSGATRRGFLAPVPASQANERSSLSPLGRRSAGGEGSRRAFPRSDTRPARPPHPPAWSAHRA